LAVLYRYSDSDYPFGIIKLFLRVRDFEIFFSDKIIMVIAFYLNTR
jgi:hypothetical protein